MAKITIDMQVFSYIQSYKIAFKEPVVQTPALLPRNVYFSSSEKSEMSEAIKNLISIGAVSKCLHCEGQFISSYFLVPKPNGKARFVLNLKKLNKFIDTDHFKIEDLRTALKLISKNCFMSTLDLKDAYFLVKIHPDSRKYLRFIYNEEIFEFNVLPFGLCTAPYVFTKVMKPIIKLLRCKGHLSTVYLDDFLLVGCNYDSCMSNVIDTSNLLKSMGFIINTNKSNLLPTNNCKFLGFIINSNTLQLSLPADKVSKIKAGLLEFQRLKSCKIRVLAHLIGLLNSACDAIQYGRIYTKELERVLYLNLLSNDNYDRYMTIPNSLSQDLKWWLNSIVSNSGKKIGTDSYSCEIFSGASTIGWGSACGNNKVSGLWSVMERQNNIISFFRFKIICKK